MQELYPDDPSNPDEDSPTAFAFYAPGQHLPALDASHLEAALLILAAEDIDAVVLWTEAEQDPFLGCVATEPPSADETSATARLLAVYHRRAYRYAPDLDQIIPLRPDRLVKWLPPSETTDPVICSAGSRGPYRSNVDLPGRLRVGVRDVHQLRRPQLQRPRGPGERPTLLVLAPFLARGGAEQTLFATLEHLRNRFDYLFVTLAPHRQELGDRRPDFRQLSPRLFSLGDWVHPAAMLGVLAHLIEVYDVPILYNANGTTLFYEFAPQLKARFPELRILDHLYDHRVGYIERYDDALRPAIDACVAENHPIQAELVQRGWPLHKVPVVWPCGRPRDAFPEDIETTRRERRRELGWADDDVIFLAAMRMHSQKRPLDLVALAARCTDLKQLRIIVVGGGDLEDSMDTAIAAVPQAPIQRLPFRQDIPELICAADLGCLVSDYEGLPVFLLECLQVGRPFLGTDVGELGRVLRDSGAGLVVDTPGDLDALEQAMRQLMDDSLRQRLAARARAAAAHFSVAACADRYARAFLAEPLASLEGVLLASQSDTEGRP